MLFLKLLDLFNSEPSFSLGVKIIRKALKKGECDILRVCPVRDSGSMLFKVGVDGRGTQSIHKPFIFPSRKENLRIPVKVS